jgi:hypothetical protein
MDNNVKGEMIIVLCSENVCEDCQVRTLSLTNKFIGNPQYAKSVKDLLDLFFIDSPDINLWIQLPKIISVIIDLNKSVKNNGEIDIDYMKFIIYAIIYSYLDKEQPIALNKLNQGDIRIGLLNILSILITKPKKIKVLKQTLINILTNCICGDDDIIKL